MNPDFPSHQAYYDWLFGGFAFVLGTVVGSFLNVCIYRMPLGLSVNEPRRSFCPHCKTPIAWYYNLPIVGWLWLRGKCAHCRQPIAARYPLVELLTGVLFLLVWVTAPRDPAAPFPIAAFPHWIFVALLIVATFIDFDHLMIPDEITLGCVGAGILLSAIIPQQMGAATHLEGLVQAIIGAVVGYVTLAAVVELGKLALGKKRVVLDQPEDFTWKRVRAAEPGGEDDGELAIGAETDRWTDIFNREKDRLVLMCDRLSLAGQERENVTLNCYYDRLELDGKTYSLKNVETFSGRLREYIFPREAMGYGDVKLIAGVGAFLGWPAVFFSIAAGSCVGSVVGVLLMALGPKARSLRIPFGPYLSLGALLWLFVGPALLQWYVHLVMGPGK